MKKRNYDSTLYSFQDNMTSQEKWNVLAMVSNLYYNNGMTQSEIANRLYTSRSKISRMLLEARRLGIVEINIHESWQRCYDYEEYINSKFSLKDIRVIKNRTENKSKQLDCVTEAAAYYLEYIIEKNMVIGVSWGNTLYRIVQNISKMDNKNFPITVVPIMGASNSKYPEKDAMDLAKDLAFAYGGKYHYLYTPLFVNNLELKLSLIKEQDIADVLKMAQKADLMLTSVGTLNNKNWHCALTDEVVMKLKELNAVGHIGGHFYDVKGNLCETDLEERHIGVSIQDMQACKQVICVVNGKDKAKATLGALRMNVPDVLILDDLCAKEIINIIEKGL